MKLEQNLKFLSKRKIMATLSFQILLNGTVVWKFAFSRNLVHERLSNTDLGNIL